MPTRSTRLAAAVVAPASRLRPICASAVASRAVLALAGCSVPTSGSFLRPVGSVAAAQRGLFLEIIGWMMIVVLPVFVLVPLVAWRYRRRSVGAAYRPDWSASRPMEIALWGVPVAVVAILAHGVWTKQVALDPYRPVASASASASEPAPLDIQVVGLDWKWLFIYPEQGIATVGKVVFPVGRPVRFSLTSDTVMQSFFIPALGSQIYAMAGMVTTLHLIADRPGDTMGKNTQFNGRGFHEQKFNASALPTADFDRWVTEVRATGRPLDADTYAVLHRRSTTSEARAELGLGEGVPGVLRFTVPGDDLFDRVVERYRAPGTDTSIAGDRAQSPDHAPAIEEVPHGPGGRKR